MAQANHPIGFSKRLQEIRDIWKKDSWLYGVTGLLAGFILGIAASSELRQFFTWFWDGFWNEALSIAITVIVLDNLNRLRTKEERKQELFRQAKSRSDDFAVDALRQITDEHLLGEFIEYYRRKNGVVDLNDIRWSGGVQLKKTNLQNALLLDAKLQEANLSYANLEMVRLDRAELQKANLMYAKLQGACLAHANLQDTKLAGAELQGAILIGVNLQIADVINANLENARLRRANLQKATLMDINLEGADLKDANLHGAVLIGVKFDEKTVLPDGIKWTENTVMERYTQLEHPDFWEPEYLKPDYEGDKPRWVKKQREQDS